jgi:hypothetical protein
MPIDRLPANGSSQQTRGTPEECRLDVNNTLQVDIEEPSEGAVAGARTAQAPNGTHQADIDESAEAAVGAGITQAANSPAGAQARVGEGVQGTFDGTFNFFPKLDLLGARVWVLLGARVWVENTTGEEKANDVERAPPDNMSDAQREIRALLGIRGLKQTQINMCQVALEEWQSIGQYYTKPVNERQAEVRSVRNELYQLLVNYSAFQGLLITAVAQSSLLQCPQCWFPVSALCVSHGGRCNWNGPKEHAH